MQGPDWMEKMCRLAARGGTCVSPTVDGPVRTAPAMKYIMQSSWHPIWLGVKLAVKLMSAVWCQCPKLYAADDILSYMLLTEWRGAANVTDYSSGTLPGRL